MSTQNQSPFSSLFVTIAQSVLKSCSSLNYLVSEATLDKGLKGNLKPMLERSKTCGLCGKGGGNCFFLTFINHPKDATPETPPVQPSESSTAS